MRLTTPSPFVGTFRHSPAVTATVGLGLKGILWEDELKPLMTQVQLSRGINKFADLHISPSILQVMPLFKFNSQSSDSPVDDDAPQCAICLEAFQDGDELRTLACSHLYHRKCIDVWLLGCLSDERTDTNCCPQCRKAAWSPTSSVESFEGCAIPSDSFIRLGQCLSASMILNISQSLEDSIVLTEGDMVELDDPAPQQTRDADRSDGVAGNSAAPEGVTTGGTGSTGEEEVGSVIFDVDSISSPAVAENVVSSQSDGRRSEIIIESHFAVRAAGDPRADPRTNPRTEHRATADDTARISSDHRDQMVLRNQSMDSLSSDCVPIEITSSLDDYSDCGVPLEECG